MKRYRPLFSLLVAPLLAVVLVASPVAAAGPPVPASGNFLQLSYTESNVRDTGSVRHYDFVEVDLLGGTAFGITTVRGQCTVHITTGVGQCHARADFVGSIGGRSGTAEFNEVFEVNRQAATLSGHFTVLHGAGGLDDLHGEGTFGGSVFFGGYAGQMHFSP